MSACERFAPLLDGYHDGELGRLRRWTVRRHLDGCGACREELAALADLGGWVRDASSVASPVPDLWSELRWRLPARAPAGAAGRRAVRGSRVLGVPMVGAGVAAAALALFVLPGPPQGGGAGTVLRSLNTHGRPVMVLSGPQEATIIWLMDEDGVQISEDASSVWI